MIRSMVKSATFISSSLVFWSLFGVAAARPIGSYTFSFSGVAPADAMLRITAAGTAGALIDATFPIGGLDQNKTADKVYQVLRAAGALVQLTETNSVSISGIVVADVSQNLIGVDGGSSSKGLGPEFDGKVLSEEVAPGAKWVANFAPLLSPEQAAATEGATAAFTPSGDPPGLTSTYGTITFFIPAGTTPSMAAFILYEALLSAGYPDVSLSGSSGVSFLQAPNGEPIDTISQFSFSGAGLELGLEFPATVPEPNSGVLLSVAIGLMAALRLLYKQAG
jgi:hypothetical protein